MAIFGYNFCSRRFFELDRIHGTAQIFLQLNLDLQNVMKALFLISIAYMTIAKLRLDLVRIWPDRLKDKFEYYFIFLKMLNLLKILSESKMYCKELGPISDFHCLKNKIQSIRSLLEPTKVHFY